MQKSLDSAQIYEQYPTNGNGPSTTNERGSTSAVVVPADPMAGLPASELQPRKRSYPKTKSKPMRSRQLFSSITATTAGSIYFDIPDATTIRGVIFTTHPTSFTAADYLELEVSLSATGQTRTTDAQGVLACACATCTGGGSPANISLAGVNVYLPVNVSVKPGTRVYLNALESGSGTWQTRALVWFD